MPSRFRLLESRKHALRKWLDVLVPVRGHVEDHHGDVELREVLIESHLLVDGYEGIELGAS